MADAEAKLRISAENRTQQAFNEIRRGIRDVEGASNGLRSALAGLGIGLSLGGLAAFAKSGIDAADNLNKLSQRVGVAVESLSAMQYAAKLSDVSVEQLNTGLRQLAKNATDTQSGTGEAAEAFRALGIAVTSAGGEIKGTEELLLDVADRFSGIEDGAGKTALAMRLFGRSGADLIPFLNQGRAGFEGLRKEAERLGLIISTDTARAAEEFNDNLTRLGAQTEAIKIALGRDLLPEFSRLAEILLDIRNEADSTGASFSGLGLVFRTLGTGVLVVGSALSSVARDVAAAAAAATLAVQGDLTGAMAVFKARGEDQATELENLIRRFDKVWQQAESRTGAADRPTRRAAPALSNRGDRERDTQFQRVLQQLQDEAAKVQELTRFEEVLAGIEAGRYGKLSELQRNRLLEQAAAVDLAREDARVQKEAEAAVEEAQRRQDERSRTEAERLNTLARQYRDLIDPVEKFRRKLLEVDELIARGLISSEEATAIKFEIELEIEGANGQLKEFRDEVKRTEDISRDLGLTMASALGEIITEGGKAKDVMRALLQDIAQIAIRRQVLDPIGKGISGVLDGIFGGARALGGPVTGGVPYLVGEKGPELFIPGASGNIVPNSTLSGMGGVTIIQHISIDSRSDRASILQAMNQAKEQAKAEILDSQNRNGAFARA